MATSGRGSGVVGYKVQTAVDTKSQLIAAPEVTNQGHDRVWLANMAKQAEADTRMSALKVVALCRISYVLTNSRGSQFGRKVALVRQQNRTS